ncbi:MAG: Lrp/AsnC ligand binding domain-containing protein [Sphingomonadales bacterium]
MECSSITGDFDYILKVAATDPKSLEQFIIQRLLRLKIVKTTSTTFILRQMNVSGAMPKIRNNKTMYVRDEIEAYIA